LVFYPLVLVQLFLAWKLRDDATACWLMLAIAALLVLLSFTLRQLRIRDGGEYLVVRFGPLPLFGRRIRYADLRSVERGRTSVLDGWGVHWVPGRGFTYNLWGFDCVTLGVQGQTVRIGSDDVERLFEFLQGKLPRHESSAGSSRSRNK
jgi:hypothetical protein